MKKAINIFWFRRDLRLRDNAGLYHALRDENPVLPVFLFDRNILDRLDEKKDSRVQFIRDTIISLQNELAGQKSSIEVYYGFPEEMFEELMKKYTIGKVFTNHDYETYARDRDAKVKALLAKKNISFHTFKDQVIFEKDEIIKDNGEPYVVFTPYSRKWRAALTGFYLRPYPNQKYFRNFYSRRPARVPSLEAMGFEAGIYEIPDREPPANLIKAYSRQRDYPGIEGTSRMGIHLRFGTVSIRELASLAKHLNDTYLNELIWRDFYQMILWHFPVVNEGRAFRKEYDNIRWRDSEKEFAAWCEGNTGYPIVDAGMRQLNETGFMHNRVRMITASFLSKHLLIDWRWGEAYFAEKLLDFEFASNNGGWQWAAGCGCDAAPYFRIFNPTLQTKKFDPDLEYVRKWVPELDSFDYPAPIVEHDFARKRCIEAYSKALSRSS